MFNNEKAGSYSKWSTTTCRAGVLMTLNFVPARYARVQVKGSMCSPRGDWLCGGTRNQHWPTSKSRECADFQKIFTSRVIQFENPNCNKVKVRLDSYENRNVLFRSSLSLITLTIAVQDCISVGDHMIRSGFNKSIVTSFLFCQKMYIYIIYRCINNHRSSGLSSNH